MNIFFTSDQHYFHKNIISYTNRPFVSVEEMNEVLIENHNKIVKPKDTIYMVGDFCFTDKENTIKLINRLNGNKYLVHGNHDKNIIKNKSSFTGKNLFCEIDLYKEINIVGYPTICLFHYAMRTWNKAYHGSWHLFGHSHGKLEPSGKSVDVGVDSSFITGNKEYRPFAIEEIKTLFALV